MHRRGSVYLINQIVNLLSTLQDALDSLVENNLGLIQLLLNLHDTVHLVWVLVRRDVCLQGGEGDRLGGGACVGVEREELIEDLGKDLMGGKRGVFIVADNDTGDALGPRIHVECEI